MVVLGSHAAAYRYPPAVMSSTRIWLDAAGENDPLISWKFVPPDVKLHEVIVAVTAVSGEAIDAALLDMDPT